MLQTPQRSALVTGATGFVGRHIVAELVKRGWDITTLSRSSMGTYSHMKVDLRDTHFALGGTYDTVFHAAGLAHTVPNTPAEAAAFFRVNARGTQHLLNAIKGGQRLPKSIVLISTVAVYGKKEGAQLTEEAPRNATDPYGASKREAEDTVLSWCENYGVTAGIVRLPLVVGREAPGNLRRMVEAMHSRRYVGIGNGSARRSMVLAEDVAEILPIVADKGGIFNLTDGCHPSFWELESELSHVLGRRPPYRIPVWLATFFGAVGTYVSRVADINVPVNSQTVEKMVSTLTIDDSKARELLGWKPRSVLSVIDELVIPQASVSFDSD